MIDFYYWPTPNGHKIAISPNNRVPAIVDHDGPEGAPHAVFESGVILLYLCAKTGRFWPEEPLQQSLVIQWLFFQCANIGPMFGQCGHFRGYASEEVPYAIDRYSGEVQRLYGLLDRRLADNAWIVGDYYSIADMAHYPWMDARQQQLHGIDIDNFPHVARWIAAMQARPAVQRGMAKLAESMKVGSPTEETRKAFFFRK